MQKKLFVRNLSWGVSDDQLMELFSQHGEVEEAIVIKERDTGRSKGFGFVTFADEAAAAAAIDALNETEIEGRPMYVAEARPREDQE